MSEEGGADAPRPGQEASGKPFFTEDDMRLMREETAKMGPEGVKGLLGSILRESGSPSEQAEGERGTETPVGKYTRLSNQVLVDYTHYRDSEVTFDREGFTTAFGDMLAENPDIAQPLIENFKRKQQEEGTDH